MRNATKPRLIAILLAFLGIAPFLPAQQPMVDINGHMGIGTLSPDPAAILDLTSTTAGLLVPRMTTAQRDAIPAPPNGLLIFNTDLNSFQHYVGPPTSAWTTIVTDFNLGGVVWKLSGNGGTTAGTHFLGTTDNQPFEIHVDEAGYTASPTSGRGRAMRFEPTSTSPNIIAGHHTNSVASGLFAAVIGGGGANGFSNSISGAGNYAVVNGGLDNIASGIGTAIGGGVANRASGAWSVIDGGSNDTTSGSFAAVGGGVFNHASQDYAVVGGGITNKAFGGASTIGGGQENLASAIFSTVGGGFRDTASGNGATVGGGRGNVASGFSATVAGGRRNVAAGDYSAIAGGYQDTATGQLSVIVGGANNGVWANQSGIISGELNAIYGERSFIGVGLSDTITGNLSVIAGGFSNRVTADYAVIGGGRGNLASATYATVGGGLFDTASGNGATVGGGRGNVASGLGATVAGGRRNVAAGDFSAIGGGFQDTAVGHYSVIAGGLNNDITGNFSAIAGGQELRLGGNSFGFNGTTAALGTDLTAFAGLAFFGNTDLWIGNDDNAARGVRFIEPNTDLDYSSANYSAFRAQAQTADITYTLPAALPPAASNVTPDLGSGILQTDNAGSLQWRQIATTTAALNFVATPAGSFADLTLTVNGARSGDAVTLGIPDAAMTIGNVHFSGWVSANNTVTVRFHNNTGAAQSVNQTFGIVVMKP